MATPVDSTTPVLSPFIPEPSPSVHQQFVDLLFEVNEAISEYTGLGGIPAETLDDLRSKVQLLNFQEDELKPQLLSAMNEAEAIEMPQIEMPQLTSTMETAETSPTKEESEPVKKHRSHCCRTTAILTGVTAAAAIGAAYMLNYCDQSSGIGK